MCTPSAPATEYLFGNDLQKQIKDLIEAKKMTQTISGHVHKKPSHFYKTSKRYQRYGSDLNSDRNPKQKSFLDKRARFHKKVSKEGETPWSGPKTVNIDQDQFPADDNKDNNISAVSTNNFDLKNLPDNFDIWVLNIVQFDYDIGFEEVPPESLTK